MRDQHGTNASAGPRLELPVKDLHPAREEAFALRPRAMRSMNPYAYAIRHGTGPSGLPVIDIDVRQQHVIDLLHVQPDRSEQSARSPR